MMSRLLTKLIPWALVAALVAGIGLMWRLNGLRAELEQTQQQHAKAQAALDITAATLAVQVERNRLLVEALDVRERELNDGAQRIDRLRAQADALGVDDADDVSKTWANQYVPIGVADWVRRLTRPDTSGADTPSAAVVPETLKPCASASTPTDAPLRLSSAIVRPNNAPMRCKKRGSFPASDAQTTGTSSPGFREIFGFSGRTTAGGVNPAWLLSALTVQVVHRAACF